LYLYTSNVHEMNTIYDVLTHILPLLVLVGGILLVMKKFFDNEQNRRISELKKSVHETSLPLRLQSYERLILLLERLNPENLLFRVYKPGMSAKLFHSELTRSVREEFEHNLTQQMYISSMAWEMIKKSKDELLKTIHLSASKMPDQALRTRVIARKSLNTYTQTRKTTDCTHA
jgi:hypothetical protein